MLIGQSSAIDKKPMKKRSPEIERSLVHTGRMAGLGFPTLFSE
jgi:hypothetical protein